MASPGERFRAGVLSLSPRCYFRGPDCDGRLDAHHLIRQQTLKGLAKRGLIEDLEGALADPRNGIAVCRRHHAHRVHYLRRDDLPESVEAFAEQWGVAAELDREYGPSADPDRPVARPIPRPFGQLRQRIQ